MTFLFINTHERAALMGLPYIQQLAYLVAIRPYMDRETHIVGIKRRISYQSLAEELYVEPHPGIKSGSPSRSQLRRAIKGLERADLILIQSDDKQLILKCLLADGNYSASKKTITNSSSKSVTKTTHKNRYKTSNYINQNFKSVIGEDTKAVTPQKSEKLSNYMRVGFEKFWGLYPQRVDKISAIEQFKNLNPDDELLEQILSAIRAQIQNREELSKMGEWVPLWKNPANWLANQRWKDDLLPIKTKEKNHETHQFRTGRKSAADLLSESCPGADFDFNFEDEQPDKTSRGENILAFNSTRNPRETH